MDFEFIFLIIMKIMDIFREVDFSYILFYLAIKINLINKNNHRFNFNIEYT